MNASQNYTITIALIVILLIVTLLVPRTALRISST